MTNAVRRLIGAALILAESFAAAAQAQTAATGQEPPPQADAGTTGQSKCIDEDDHYKMRGKHRSL